MLASLTQRFARMTTAGAGPSSGRLFARPCDRSTAFARPSPVGMPGQLHVRHRGDLAPRRVKHRKAHKGRVSLPTGGSVKGTTVQQGMYGIRLLQPTRLTAKQLQTADAALKKKLKGVKGAQIFMRVFPDIPVCVKGNEVRMGKGKGSFHHWGCRASIGRVIFEVGGPLEIRPEIAREALRVAGAKLPVPFEFITRSSPPRLGNLVDKSLASGSAIARAGAGIVQGAKTDIASPSTPTSLAQALPVQAHDAAKNQSAKAMPSVDAEAGSSSSVSS